MKLKDKRLIKDRLLSIGEKQYQFGRFGIYNALPITLALTLLFFIVHLIAGSAGTFIEAFAFEFYMADFLQAIVVIAIYLGLLISVVSIPFYFSGLHYSGLGQIAENTEKK